MKNIIFRYILIVAIVIDGYLGLANNAMAKGLSVNIESPVIPVLVKKDASPFMKLTFVRENMEVTRIDEIVFDLSLSSDFRDIEKIGIYGQDIKGNISSENLITSECVKDRSRIKLHNICFDNLSDTMSVWVAVTLKEATSLDHKIMVLCREISYPGGRIRNPSQEMRPLRVGIAVRQKGQDNVASSRIPGIATTEKGTLIAIFDARYDGPRDLQGNIDIASHRSFDKGQTWEPMQIALDMGEWGGLPEKYNGVSDACILVNENNGDIYIAGLWMHGVLDSDGRWVENLTEDSTEWMHQWRSKGSQPGYSVRQTSQFIITRSCDDGETWSLPENITRKTKKEEWWLYAPAPGHGITMSDSTLVFPSQGRDKNGKAFSNITWSNDNGITWHASNPAYMNVTECNVAELNDGSLMLNMRYNRNRGVRNPNGRIVCTTSDLGDNWIEHVTSHRILTEPTCMASLHRHEYLDGNGRKKSMLLFVNPNNYASRDNMTLKISFDDGKTWPEEHYILFDQYRCAGYSSITSVDNEHIGILYESSQAELAFIRISIDEILKHYEKHCYE